MNVLAHRITSLAVLVTAGAFLAGSAARTDDSSNRADGVHGREGKVKANGITIAYEDFGPENRETMLLIMGNGTQLTAWPIELIEDRRTKLKTIKVPTVVVHGAEDPLMSVEGGKDTAANIPGAELRIIPGMGHDLPIPLAKTIADAIVSAASRATGAKAAK